MAYFPELVHYSDVQTTDDIPKTIYTIPVDANSVMHFRVVASAFRPSNADAAAYELNATVKRASGNVILIGLQIVIAREDVGAATWGIDASGSGSNVLVQVLGQSAATIEWTAVLNRVVSS